MQARHVQVAQAFQAFFTPEAPAYRSAPPPPGPGATHTVYAVSPRDNSALVEYRPTATGAPRFSWQPIASLPPGLPRTAKALVKAGRV